MSKCISCKCKLPPLNGSEENDFSWMCNDCKDNMDDEIQDLNETGYNGEELAE